jgi:hypothetical protein
MKWFALPLALLAADAPPPSLGLRSLKAPPEVSLVAAPAAAPLSESRPMKIGEHRILSAAQLSKGQWTKSPRLWRLAVKSTGAAAMRVHFRDFHAGKGQVWVHNGKDWFGPYSADGMYGDGDFWSHVVPGDRLLIEYAGDASKAPFVVREVSHLTVNPLE